MKAIVYTEYGPPDILQLKEFEKSAPKEDEVLIIAFQSIYFYLSQFAALKISLLQLALLLILLAYRRWYLRA